MDRRCRGGIYLFPSWSHFLFFFWFTNPRTFIDFAFSAFLFFEFLDEYPTDLGKPLTRWDVSHNITKELLHLAILMSQDAFRNRSKSIFVLKLELLSHTNQKKQGIADVLLIK